ncbi:hypothetical protein GH714_017707 [Hevea brasiliensis]|uniref:Uncharacterized protein n=1 Tax=Hevea brasiliensis TaxID=3981 RepID=A0A6A6LPL2_HEVBR|nr:hypothetical protein GH714_017707 [Hevea brasiliensis]
MDASQRQKHRKKSSKTVVIRNVNYITRKREEMEKKPVSLMNLILMRMISLIKIPSSKRLMMQLDHWRNCTNQGRAIIGKKVHTSKHISNGSNDAAAQDLGDDIVSNPIEGEKTNDQWDAFENHLMRDKEATVNGVERLHPMDVPDEHFTVKSLGVGTALANNCAMDLELEKVPKQPMAASDSFVVAQREGGSEEQDRMKDIGNADNLRSVMRRRDSIDADLVNLQRMEESGNGLRVILSAIESSTTKPGNREDWDRLNVKKSRKHVVLYDSFMIHDRPAVEDLCDSWWKTDINMVADLTLSSQPGNGTVKENHEILGGYEPNDLCVVLEWDSGLESGRESWTSDHGIDISFMETERRS